MKTILALVLWLLVPLLACSEPLAFTSIEKTPITSLIERLLSRAYHELGYTIKTVVVPSRRSLQMANSGLVDGDLFRIAGAEKAFPNLVAVPYPLAEGRLMAVTMTPALTEWSRDQLSDAVIGVRRGIIIAERATHGMQTIVVSDFDQMLELLRVGRIDVGIVSEVEGVSSMTDQQLASVIVLPKPVATFSLYHYLHKKHQDMVLPLSRAIQHLVENGEFRAIINAAQHPQPSSERHRQ